MLDHRVCNVSGHRAALGAFEQSALNANHSAQFDHSADLGGVASDIIIKAFVGKFSRHARGFRSEVANVVAILGVGDHDSLLDQVNNMSSIIEGLNHETITNN